MSAWIAALLWFCSGWSQNPSSRWVWIFTLRSWIRAWRPEKAVRHASEDRLNTEQLKAEWSDYSWSYARQQKDWAVKDNMYNIWENLEFIVVHSPCISAWRFKKVHCCTTSCFFPDKFIQRGEETDAVLHRLVSHGKKLFLITNSPFGFV